MLTNFLLLLKPGNTEMADILTAHSYQDELYNPHMIQQQSQNMQQMQYTNSFQHPQMFPQNNQQPQSHPWFDAGEMWDNF